MTCLNTEGKNYRIKLTLLTNIIEERRKIKSKKYNNNHFQKRRENTSIKLAKQHRLTAQSIHTLYWEKSPKPQVYEKNRFPKEQIHSHQQIAEISTHTIQ